VGDRLVAVVVRVGTPGRPCFQLRAGEAGLSVFDPAAVEPPLAEDELLAPFRPGSVLVYRTYAEVAAAGLAVAVTDGADVLPDRLRAAHREIVAGPGQARPAFKAALKLLE
jgi:hypothetical protein